MHRCITGALVHRCTIAVQCGAVRCGALVHQCSAPNKMVQEYVNNRQAVHTLTVGDYAALYLGHTVRFCDPA